jgi:hypothetical protein
MLCFEWLVTAVPSNGEAGWTAFLVPPLRSLFEMFSIFTTKGYNKRADGKTPKTGPIAAPRGIQQWATAARPDWLLSRSSARRSPAPVSSAADIGYSNALVSTKINDPIRGARRPDLRILCRQWRPSMRLILVLAVTAAALLLNVRAGQAYEGPWCAQYNVGRDFVYEDCSMPSIEVCRQHVIAGNRGTCTQNPRWPGYYGVAVKQPRAYRHHRRHKRRARRH